MVKNVVSAMNVSSYSFCLFIYGNVRNSIGHDAFIVNLWSFRREIFECYPVKFNRRMADLIYLIEYKMSPSCVSRSNLFGTVIVCT